MYCAEYVIENTNFHEREFVGAGHSILWTTNSERGRDSDHAECSRRSSGVILSHKLCGRSAECHKPDVRRRSEPTAAPAHQSIRDADEQIITVVQATGDERHVLLAPSDNDRRPDSPSCRRW